ncbi:MAG: DNA polymerase IV [Patescibacteria group bacterium]
MPKIVQKKISRSEGEEDTEASKPNVKEKAILHMDGDAFFVGVEIAKNPKLRGLPVVTGEERGIVSALSYEAKALGVIRGMPIFRLKKDFPKVIILPGDYASYARYSSKMFDIVRRYADDVEEYSIDECFADLTGLEATLKMTYRQMAERIKQEINNELDLSVSIGVAPTKVLAKVASKWVKPKGLTVITAKTAGDFLSQTPIEKIWGIGGQTSQKMWRNGIKTAKDFIDKDLNWVRHFFPKPDEVIWQELSGISVMPIDPNAKTTYSSIQKTRTFHPATNDKNFLLAQLSKNIEEACTKARHYKLVPKKLSLFLKTQDFQYTTSLVSLPSPTNAPEVLMTLAGEQLKNMHKRGILYRTTGVTLRELVPDSVSQADLFGSRELADKFEVIHKRIDSLENKLGKRVVHLASTHAALKPKGKFGKKAKDNEPTDFDDLDRDLLFL